MQLIKVPEWVAKLPLMGRFRISAKDILNNRKAANVSHVQIVQEYKDKNAKDNKDWRDAYALADDPTNPQWHLLQDLYDYVLVDAHTHSLIELRHMATLSTPFYVIDATSGQEQPEKTLLLKKQWFYTLCSEVLMSRARAYTVAQLINSDTMEFFYVPRRNFVPQKNFIRQSVQGNIGVSINDDAFAGVINVKDNYLFGYLNDIVPLILWKMNAMMSWAEAAERYGIPPLIATTTRRDDKSISDIQNMLSSIGESLTAVLPEGTKIEVMANAEKVDPEKMFRTLVQTCDEQISKRILGGTMITDNGSSRSQSEVHQSNFDDKVAESDKRFLEFFVNDQLLPLMGVFSENDRFEFDRSQELTLKEHWEIVQGILQTHEVDEEWLKKTFQVPITGKKINPAFGGDASLNFNEAPKAWAAALGAYGITLPNYTGSCNHSHDAPTADWTDDLLSELSDALINDVWQNKPTLMNEVLKSIASYRKLLNGLNESWSNRKTIPYDSSDVHCLAYMEYNLFEFSRLKEKANVFALNRLLINKEKNNIRSFEDFKDKARHYLANPDVNWLRTEYNHAMAVGQNASRYHDFKRQGVKYLQWRTVGDSHVRQSHQILEGKIFKTNDGMRIYPPKDWGCRCEMTEVIGEPDATQVMTSEQGLQVLNIPSNSKWALNRGEIEQVFTANEMYYKESGLEAEFNKELTRLQFGKYGLEKLADKTNLPSINIKDVDVAKYFKKEKGTNYMGFEDYLGRKLSLKENNFKKHTSGDYATDRKGNRDKLFPFVQDILNNPDEVYFVNYNKRNNKTDFQTNYIKFYTDENGKNRCLLVNTTASSTGLEINTWFEVDNENNRRRGYLIHLNKSKKP
ncbi:MAG: DUF935 family protein [Bacteroidia bacterium]|nr:DUF935 family protein [Bacteroidia bacterium]